MPSDGCQFQTRPIVLAHHVPKHPHPRAFPPRLLLKSNNKIRLDYRLFTLIFSAIPAISHIWSDHAACAFPCHVFLHVPAAPPILAATA